MTLAATNMLYVALAFYALGTMAALASLFAPSKRLQYSGLLLMIAGFVAHTIWIGSICRATGHPPITNLPEVTSFVAWCVFVVELVLWIRFRVYAASFFVYPLVLLLLTVSATFGEQFAVLDPTLRSNVFTAHLLFSTIGVAGMLIGVAFGLLAFIQDRALKQKIRGRMWTWIPNLNVCKAVGYRALAIGFSVYTIGLIAGVMWSYRTTAGIIDLRVKQIGAVVAWVLFGILLQQYIAGAYRSRRTILLSATAFIAVVVAILGIRG